ncbi:hypothetical protein QQX98_012190 [Neonectria punicea]|uniref:F-box domain-containing protein n=1 Tax=Neonectria punicea TaxID=979145 RepID=A0ABR1GJU5_9HYPO
MESEKERQRATPEPRPPSQLDPALYQQKESMLFRLLPQEFHLKIYAHLFSSKRLQWGARKGKEATCPRTRPRQTLALVRTCRRVRDEIGDTWIGQIHLTFKTPEALLDDIPGDWIDGLPLGTEEDETLTKEGERGKEMMVVFKRGFGVDYEEKEGSPFLKRDIRRNAPGMTWQEIRRINLEGEFPLGDSDTYSQDKWESEEDD